MYKFLAVSILILLNGCSVKQPQKRPLDPVLKTSLPVCKDTNATSVVYDAGLPQELEPELPQYVQKVNDLEYYPQSMIPYVERNGVNQEKILDVQNGFEENYYRPWSYTTAPICLKEAKWPVYSFTSGYGSNLKPVESGWIEHMVSESNFDAFATLNKPALTTRWMDIRVFPTRKPLYKNPALPGEGYPFDMLQNSSVGFNEPIFVSHFSRDGSWAYVFTNNASGWVESDGVSFVTPQQQELFRKKQKLFITDDKIPLYNNENRFVAYSRIGMVLPLAKDNGDDGYSALYLNAKGSVDEVIIPKESAHIGIRMINKEELIKIGTHLLRNTYGWGGMYEERDCSSMIRDMYTPFGIWLPRNSASQAKKGEVISFEGLDNNQKIALIKEKGIPFETILYKKGHVLLYIGTYEDKVMAMHNIWGIRTIDQSGRKGRVIVGKTVISTLELGSNVENFDPEHMLLTKLVSMNTFTRAPSVLQIAQKKKKTKLSKL